MNKPTSSVADDQEVLDPAVSQDPAPTDQVSDANIESTQSSGVESEGAKEPKTLEDVVQTALERAKPKQETAQPAEEDEDPAKAETDLDAKAASEEKPEEKLPFHNHPRWKEVLHERDEYRDRAQKFDAITSFMDQNSLTSEQVTDGFEVMALMNKNPAQALERIEEIRSNLRQYLGLELPDDLKSKVDEGYVDEATAQELVRKRNEAALAEAKLTLRERSEQERMQNEQEASVRQSMATAVDGYIQQIQTKDPDYSVKEAFIVDRVQVLRMQNPPKTPEDAVELVKQAYTDASERLKALAPRRQPVRTTTSAASTSTTAKPEPKSLQEAIELSLRK